jgi:hypothetical protein
MNPVWYFADGYLDVLPYLPRPVTYLWSERGFAATPELREHFAVAQEVIVPHSDALRSDPALADFQADAPGHAHHPRAADPRPGRRAHRRSAG